MLTKFYFLNFFRFLILDPHYTGSEDLKLINGKVRDISYAAEPGQGGSYFESFSAASIISLIFRLGVWLEGNEFLGSKCKHDIFYPSFRNVFLIFIGKLQFMPAHLSTRNLNLSCQ